MKGDRSGGQGAEMEGVYGEVPLRTGRTDNHGTDTTSQQQNPEFGSGNISITAADRVSATMECRVAAYQFIPSTALEVCLRSDSSVTSFICSLSEVARM